MLVELIRSVGKRRFPLIARDPQPLEKFEGMWRVGAQAAVIGLFFFACIAALEYARPILLPIVAAFMLGMMLSPLSNLTTRLHIPAVVSAIFLWLLVVVIFYGLVMLLSAPLVEWAGKGSELGHIIKDKLTVLDRPIAMIQELRTALFPRAKDQPDVAFSFVSVMQPAVLFVTPAIGQMVIFFGTLFFFLLGRTQLRQVLVVFFKRRAARLRMLRILNDIEHNLTSYLSLVTIINAVVGVMAFAVTYAVGLPNPVVWGVLAFLFNFVPYLGALLMEFILLMAGLVSFSTLGEALIAP
jgi:predicted PurR-regulated permease PerM